MLIYRRSVNSSAFIRLLSVSRRRLGLILGSILHPLRRFEMIEESLSSPVSRKLYFAFICTGICIVNVLFSFKEKYDDSVVLKSVLWAVWLIVRPFTSVKDILNEGVCVN